MSRMQRKTGWLRMFLGGVIIVLTHTPAWADQGLATEESAQKELVRKQLQEAKAVLLEAEKQAEEMIRSARSGVNLTEASGNPGDILSPLLVQNAKVSIEINGGTLTEIITEIMPADWRVLVDVKDNNVKKRRFQFVSTRSREQALHDLLKPIGMKHQYFFDLKNGQGAPSPLLVVSKDR